MPVTTSITAFLTVKNAKEAFIFYTEAFGAVLSQQSSTADGTVMGRLSIGEAGFWVGDEEPACGNISPTTPGAGSVRMILIVADPDRVFNNALKAGATQICPVTTEAYWKIGKLADPFGHVWEIGHPLA